VRVLLLSNQGLMGGGEVMLLNVAGALRDLGHEPVVVAPSHQPELLSTAHRAGHRIAGIRSRGRADYLLALRRWALRQSPALLWANGFLPATATSGLSNRVVHLHQVPALHLQPLVPAALHRATAVIAPACPAPKSSPTGLKISVHTLTDRLHALPRLPSAWVSWGG
jgi:hypothetical protein